MKRMMIVLTLLLAATSVLAQPLPPKLERMGRSIGGGAQAEIVAITWSNDGTLLMLDAHGQRLLEVKQRVAVEVAGGFGFGKGSLRGATDVNLAGFETWICDPLAGRIVRLDARYAPLDPLTSVKGSDGSERITLERPGSVARSSMGDIAILEMDLAEVLLLDSDGVLLRRVAGFGENSQPLLSPMRVEVSPSSVIAIADPGSASAILTDRFGTVLGQRAWTLGGRGPTGLAFYGEQLLLAGEEGVILYDESGEQIVAWPASLFGGPVRDIAVNGDVIATAVNSFIRTFQILPGE